MIYLLCVLLLILILCVIDRGSPPGGHRGPRGALGQPPGGSASAAIVPLTPPDRPSPSPSPPLRPRR